MTTRTKAASETAAKPENVIAAIAAVSARIGPVGKDSVNEQQRFRYRSIHALVDAMNPLLAEYGVVIAPIVSSMENSVVPTSSGRSQTLTVLTVDWNVYGPGGVQDVISATTVGMGIDMSDKSANKAMSAAYKYLLGELFCVPFEGMTDGDAETPERAQPEDPIVTEARRIALADLTAQGQRVDRTLEQITANWRQAHGNMSMEAFSMLPPDVLARQAESTKAFIDRQEAARASGTPSQGNDTGAGENGAADPVSGPESTSSGLGEPGTVTP